MGGEFHRASLHHPGIIDWCERSARASNACSRGASNALVDGRGAAGAASEMADVLARRLALSDH